MHNSYIIIDIKATPYGNNDYAMQFVLCTHQRFLTNPELLAIGFV